MNGMNDQEHQEAVDETIAWAQEQLNTHPDFSPFWDSSRGQEVLEIAKTSGLQANNTDADRREIHSAAMRSAREDMYA